MLRRLLLAPLLAGLLLLPTPVAHADTWEGADASGDVHASTYQPEPPPCGTFTDEVRPEETSHDIVRLAVTHRRAAVRLVVDFRDLSRRGQHSTDLFLRTAATTWELDVSRDGRRGKTRTFLARAPDYEAAAEDANECGMYFVNSGGPECPGLEARVLPRRDRVVAVIPRSCLRNPRWVRAAATAYGDGSGDSTLHDRWVPEGRADNNRVIGPMGPRVRRSAAS
ncbi:hypothetical protein [Nocardioides dongkuii]|uniref:hypothetical protein n=1 Tax=Nocardioides dongkuii TaxID=2760089 RepID=UPI001877AB2A|nr:hypothetical protein [Nocardioides dongkuii]